LQTPSERGRVSAGEARQTLYRHWPTRAALLVGPVFARLFYDRAEVTWEFVDMVVFHWLARGRHRYDRCEQGE
jgi:hypothetical protein